MAEPPPVQFSLKTILAITAAVALFFGAGSWFGAAGYVGGLVIAMAFAVLSNSRIRLAERLVISCAVAGVSVVLSWPLFHQTKPSTRTSTCKNNLHNIALALQAYANVYHCFPPVCITDGNGRPMHSWRVLILPNIEQGSLYRRYKFDEPWDSPHNSQLAREMPPFFRCPSDRANPRTITDYLAVVGPQTIWQPDQGTTFAEIKDGSSNTIAVIKAAGAGVNWMEPRDLPFAALDKGINPKQGRGVSSMHPGAVVAVFADGHTQTIEQSISLESLKALFTKAGGEEIDEEY